LDPIRSLDEENVVAKPYDIGGLEHKEDMPCCWSVVGIIEGDDAGNKLRRDDAEPSSIRDLAKYVCSSAAITLRYR
jgi:hypothetical protein